MENIHVTRHQKFRNHDSTGDSDATWDLGHWADNTEYTYSTKTVAYTPFTPAFWPSTGTLDAPLSSITQTISQAALKSGHVNGIHVGMADGSARYIDSEIYLEVFRNLADRADGKMDDRL